MKRNGSGDERFSDQYIEEKAIRFNQSILYSDDYKLLLDIDNAEDFETFETNFAIAKMHIAGFPKTYVSKRSKNGHRHVIVVLLQPYDITTRIMLQSFLGSDRKRDLLSYIGLSKGQKNPVVLFRPQDEVWFNAEQKNVHVKATPEEIADLLGGE